jgi:hypothetical protein
VAASPIGGNRWGEMAGADGSGGLLATKGLPSQLTNLTAQLAQGAHCGRGEPGLRASTASCREANGSKTKEVPQGSSSSKNAGHRSSSPSATGPCSKTWPQQHDHQRCCASPVVTTRGACHQRPLSCLAGSGPGRAGQPDPGRGGRRLPGHPRHPETAWTRTSPTALWWGYGSRAPTSVKQTRVGGQLRSRRLDGHL